MNPSIAEIGRQFAATPGPLLGVPRPIPTIGARAYDADAAKYIDAVESADGELLEASVASAINDFVVGCKADQLWSAFRTCCIFMGARTLSGALTALVGPAVTNNNFVAGNYNRRTGLLGDGGTKWINTNYAHVLPSNSSESPYSRHMSVWATTHHTRNITRAMLGAGGAGGGTTELLTTSTGRYYRVVSDIATFFSDTSTAPGFWGAARFANNQTLGLYAGQTVAFADTANAPQNYTWEVFTRGNAQAGNISIAGPSNARLSFYSAGAALQLSALEARVSALNAAITAAIQQ